MFYRIWDMREGKFINIKFETVEDANEYIKKTIDTEHCKESDLIIFNIMN